MSASLTVVYGGRRLQIPVTPATSLSEVRDSACRNEKLGLSPHEYTLSRQGKQLDLTLPFRFSNLVSNAQVDLVKKPVHPGGNNEKQFRVKIRVVGGTDFVGTFVGSTEISSLLQEAKLNGDLKLGTAVLDKSATLGSLGNASGGLLFQFCPSKQPPKQTKQTKQTAPQKTTQPPQTTKLASPKQSQTQQPTQQPTTSQADRACPITIPSASSTSDAAPEIGTKQFLDYYNHIKTQAEPPLLSKSTAEKLNAAKQKQLDSLVIRIKFPDQTLLEGKFKGSEYGKDVYDFITSYLREVHPFELISIKPDFVVTPESMLVADCNFGSRTLLYFVWKEPRKLSKPILTDKALALISTNQPQQPAGPSNASASKSGAEKTEQNDLSNTGAPQKKNKLKVVPKWLKLHK